VSQKLMSVTRQCVSARLPNTCATVNKKKLIKKKLLTSCLRVGRVSGPYGHAGGRELNELRILCCSQLVKNAMPRSKLGSIVVSYHAAGQKNTICELIPYYIGVKDKVCRAVSPPFNAIPRLGWIVNNKDVSTKLQQQNTNESLESKTCTQVFKTEVASLFSGACILSGLFRRHPELHSGADSVHNMMALYDSVVKQTAPKSAMNGLLDLGRCSVIIENTFGHLDSYQGKRTNEQLKSLQSKYVLKIGRKSSLRLSGYLQDGTIPPGSLAYPRYKVYTICRAMKDVELHSLDNTVHFSSRFKQGPHCSRGGWFSNGISNELEYYADCCAMTRLVDIN
jgi:hypothetical protein